MSGIRIIWIDENIEDEEYKDYKKELKSEYIQIDFFQNIESGINCLKKIEFEKTKIIISGKLYIHFITKFKDNIKDIYTIPKIIVLSKDEVKFIEDNKNYESIINNSYYNYGGIKTSFKEIKSFLKYDIANVRKLDKLTIESIDFNNKLKEMKELFEEITAMLNGDITKIKKEENSIQLTFEYIDCIEKLELPLFYKSLIDLTDIEKIDKYTEFIYTKYSKTNRFIKDLLDDIISIQDIPIELLCKYYIRVYTIESDFYHDINTDLRNNKKENYLSFIKILYEGIKLKSIKLASDNMLYRGSLISLEEIAKIKNYLKNKLPKLPGAIVFSKSFLSFTKEKNIAETFLNRARENESLKKVFYILEKDDNLDYSLSTHGDIENISVFKKEKEVLFFPFSSFELKEIKEIEKNGSQIYEIKLLYLGKYIKEIENDKNIVELENKIPDSQFRKQIVEIGLIREEDINNTKQLFNQFKRFKKNIDENNRTYVIHNTIKIDDFETNEDIRIINSYEEFYKNSNKKEKYDENLENEKEIKKNIEIKINDKKIEFSYFYKFEREGEYIIEYTFKDPINKINHLFSECHNIIAIDLSKYNTHNVTNMKSLFHNCKSLTHLNLSNFDTENVVNMNNMFSDCLCLTKLNLSIFDTQNVIDMSYMFFNCESLAKLNLNGFNTDKVTNINWMFKYCDELFEENFETDNLKILEEFRKK